MTDADGWRKHFGFVGEIAVTYAGQFVGSGIGFSIQLLLQRTWGPEAYGILGTATSFGAITGVLTDIGISQGMVRYASRYLKEDPRKAHATFLAALLLRLTLNLIVSLAGFLLSRWVAISVYEMPELARPLAWIYIGLVGGTLYSYWQFFVLTHQRFKLRSILHVLAAMARAGMVVLLWLSALLTPTSMIMIDAGINSGAFLIGMVFAPRGMRDVRREELRPAAIEIGLFARFASIYIIGDVIFDQLDTLMLAYFSDERTVGLYRGAVTYAMVLSFLNISVSAVLFPKVTGVSDTSELRALLKRVVKVNGVLAACTLPAVPFVSWWIPWFQPAYVESVPIFYVLYAGLVFDLMVSPFGFVLLSLDRPAVLSVMTILKIFVNLAGNLLLIPAYGAYGAALATVGSRLFGGIAALVMSTITIRQRERDM